METLIHGDCLEKLKEIPDNSIDSIVTDPPYGLSFMGKKWDYDVPSIEIWKECLRVLKPGGYLLSFAGTRTQHRMAVRIEDAGFEIRDMIAWIYASGFPKSLNVGKQVNKLETDEWSKISKAIDNIDQQSIMEVWKRNALFATIKLSKTIIEVGINTPKSDFAQDNAVLYFNVLNKQLNAIFAELQSKGLNLISEKHEIIAQENVEQSIIPSQNLVRYAVRLSNDQEAKHLRIFTAQCDVKEWLKENTMVNHKVDEALKTLRGNKKYSNEEITGVLCAVITNALKLTILSQSNTFQNLDTKSQMECASAISATITEYTAGNLISNTVAILKSKAVDKLQGNEREVVGKSNRHNSYAQSDIINPQGNGGIPDLTKGTSEWEGWGTALKPALEPITVARKPLIGTVAENILTHGTGGINIEKSRVPTQEDVSRRERTLAGEVVCNGFCDKHESYPRSLADICAFSPQQFLDYLQHISSELKAYSSSYSNPLRDEASLPGTLGKALLGVPCDYDLLALRVEQCGRDLKGQQDSLGDYPTLSRLCDVHSRLAEGDGQADVPSLADVLADISRLLNQPENNQPNGSNLHLVFASVLFAYSCSKDLIRQHDYTSCKNKSKGARWPSNLLHDGSEEVLECFPNTKGGTAIRSKSGGNTFGGDNPKPPMDDLGYGDSGSAARFFYCAKENRSERWAYLTCNCETVKLEAWVKQDQNQEGLMGGMLQEVATSEKALTDDCSFSTSTSGKLKTEKSQKDTAFTTSTTINKTTGSKIYNSSAQQSTSDYTEDASLEEKNGGSHAQSAKDLNRSTPRIGTSHQRDGRCMGVVVPATSLESYRKSVCENCGGEVKVAAHPTQKPISLMRYLVKLVTPPGGTVLDPFTGSGSTGKACKLEGFDFIGIEREEEYVKIAKARIEAVSYTPTLL